MTENNKNTVILAAGGTGGHIFPAESLAKILLEKGYNPILVTDCRYKKRESTPEGLVIKNVFSSSLGGGLLKKIKAAFLICIGFVQAKLLIDKENPEFVVGFGGYPSFPTMMAARYSKTKIILHEQNAVMGRVNKFLAPYAYKIATSFDEVSGVYNEDQEKLVFTGNPVRESMKILRNEKPLTIKEGENFHILVVGGSQGATIFSDIVPDAIEALPSEVKKNLRVDQQCRAEDIERVKERYKQIGVSADLNSFFEDMDLRIASSHLVISRAGASTISEIAAIGRAAILVPYPHAMDDHQMANAKAIEEDGGAIVIKQDEFTPELLAKNVEKIISDNDLLNDMAKSFSDFSEVNAAENLFKLVGSGPEAESGS